MRTPSTCSLLTFLSWLNVLVHAAGLVFAAFGLRPGSPLVPISERMAYLAGAPWAWSIGWGVWMLCALALIAFLAALVRELPDAGALGPLAIVAAVAGGAVDLLCDTIYITVLPQVVAGEAPSEAVFLAFERLAFAGGLIVANGLYSVATLLSTLCLRTHPAAAPGLIGLGYAVFGSGMILAAAGFVPSLLNITPVSPCVG